MRIITVYRVLSKCNEAQYTLDRVETCLFHDRDRRCVPCERARRVSIVKLVKINGISLLSLGLPRNGVRLRAVVTLQTLW